MPRPRFALLTTTLLLACSDPVAEDETDADSSTTDPSTSGPDTTTGTPSTTSSADTSTSTGAADETSTSAADETSTGAADETSTGPAGETSTSTSTGDASSSSTGEPLVPDIEVFIGGETLGSGDIVPLPGTPEVGLQGPPLTVTVSNAGDGVLNLGGISGSGPDTGQFVLDAAEGMASLDPGADITFDVRLAPTTGGIKSLPISIVSDDPDEDPFTFTLDGHTAPNRHRAIPTMDGPSARFNAALAATEDERVLLFGGRDAANARLDDTWIFDVEEETWTALSPPSAPSVRDAHEMVYLGDDLVLLYGGNDVQGGSAVGLGDTWVFDLVTETWTEVMTPGPGPRFQHMMVAIDGGALLYGGRSSFADLQDTWLFDAATQTWSDAAPEGTPPPSGRSSAAMAFDGSDLVVLYGGFIGTSPQSGTFEYTVSTNTWANAAAAGAIGTRAVLDGVFLDAGRMIAFSGKLDSCCVDPAPGTFAYDPVANGWIDLAPPAEPPPRFNYAMVAIPGRNKAIIFGGNLTNVGAAGADDATIEYVGPQPM